MLETRPGGDVNDQQDLIVEYEYRVSNSYERDDFDGDACQEITEQFPNVATSYASTS